MTLYFEIINLKTMSIKGFYYFSEKIRNIMNKFKSFLSPLTIEVVSALSFRVAHSVEAFIVKEIDYVKSELYHKNHFTSYNSYIKLEIRNLNLTEEK